MTGIPPTDAHPVGYEVNEGVAVLTLHRPEHRNSWNLAMEDAYFGLLERASADDGVRAIVVTGTGRFFCPGLDTSTLDGIRAGQRYSDNRRQQTFATSIPKPIIAAINGSCAGIGLLQALLCDVRFADREVKMTTAFSRRGLPAEDGSSWLLSRLIGTGRTMDLLLSARVFRSDEAHELGIVERLSEPGQVLVDALTYAHDLADNVSPSAMALIKHQVWSDLACTLEESRVRAQYLLPIAKRQPDFQEGVTSFVEKRPPHFGPFQHYHF